MTKHNSNLIVCLCASILILFALLALKQKELERQESQNRSLKRAQEQLEYIIERAHYDKHVSNFFRGLTK